VAKRRRQKRGRDVFIFAQRAEAISAISPETAKGGGGRGEQCERCACRPKYDVMAR